MDLEVIRDGFFARVGGRGGGGFACFFCGLCKIAEEAVHLGDVDGDDGFAVVALAVDGGHGDGVERDVAAGQAGELAR